MGLTKITSRILDSSGVTTVGTISTGVWQGTAINQTYLVGQSGTNTGDETLARINALDITELGTISSGVWNGTVIASAYLDADTAHLSTTQTFTGAKTFSSNTTFSGDIALTGDSKIQATADLGIGARNGTTNAGAVYIGGANDNPFISPTAFFGTDGKVGIGTTSPQSPLHIAGTGLDFDSAPLGIHMGLHDTGSSQYSAMEIISSGANSGWIDFSNVNSSNDFNERIRGGAGQLQFHTGGNFTPRLTISSTGTAEFRSDQGAGNAQISARSNSSTNVNYGGIVILQNSGGRGGYITMGDTSATNNYYYEANTFTLAATANAGLKLRAFASNTRGITIGSSWANDLDAYEEGVFTPKFSRDGNGPDLGSNYSYQIGQFTRIGNMVFYIIDMSASINTATYSFLTITGLPFTSVAGSSYPTATHRNCTALTINSGYNLKFWQNGGYNYIYIQADPLTTGSSYSPSSWDSSGRINISGMYRV